MESWKRAYLTGRCFDFALALAELVDEPDFVAIGSAKYPEHVALRVGDDLYADVRGILGRKEFLAHFNDSDDAIVEIERSDIEFHCGLAGYPPPYEGNEDVEAARGAVQRVFPDGLTITEPTVAARQKP